MLFEEFTDPIVPKQQTPEKKDGQDSTESQLDCSQITSTLITQDT
jgi:hypothetical protein